MATAPDKFTIEILDDGTVKVTTDQVSTPNHVNAENLLKEIFRLAGGEVEIAHRHGSKVHYHKAADIASMEAGGGGHTH